MSSEWGSWARDSSDKFLLVGVVAGLLTYNLHILHEHADSGQIQFTNGLINNITGALLVLVTGAIRNKIASASASSKEDPKTGATIGTLKIEQTEDPK